MKRGAPLLVVLLCLVICTADSQPASRIYSAQYDEGSTNVYGCNLDGSGMIVMTMPERPKCVAVDWRSTPQKLYVGLVPVSGEGRIIRCNTDGTGQEDVITDAIGINDIELDLEHRRIYWLQNTYSDDRIFHADMDGVDADITQIYATTTPMRDLWGLALDVTNNRLWITERGGSCYDSHIMRMSLSGGGVAIIMYPCNPHDIEYFDGKIYWGDADGLEVANTDGSDVDTLVGGTHVNGLAVDATNRRIYWIDYLYDIIRRVDLDGSNRMDVVGGLGYLTNLDTDYNPAAVPVEMTDELPGEARLFQNFPNPFNATTAFSYQLSAATQVKLSVFDLLGQEVATLVNEKLLPGTYTTRWEASEQATGVYLYRLTAGSFVETKKLLLLR